VSADEGGVVNVWDIKIARYVESFSSTVLDLCRR